MIIETVLTILLSIAVMHIVVLHAKYNRLRKFVMEYNRRVADLLYKIDKECDEIIEYCDKGKKSCHSADTDKET